MYAMKTIKRILLAGLVAVVATSCTSAFYTSSGSAYDDLYAVHDRTAIANRQKAEADARRAEAEARQAEAQARQAELEAQLAELGLKQAQSGTRTDSDGVIIVDDNATRSTNVYDSYLANDYESAYARRLLGFKSATYRMPSSYFNLRYGGDYMYVTAYDPAIYNVMVSGDQVWVEPRYITSMFGTWGATNATMLVHSPWYYGWNSVVYNPWYYSSWGYPRYSWYDWNWNVCYGYGGMNLWWGWGGMYRPWHYHHYPHYHSHHIHIGGPHYGIHLGGGGGYWNRGGSYYGSRGQKPGTPSYRGGRSIVNRGSRYSTPYRSPNSGLTYGDSSRSNGSAVKNNQSQTQPSRTGSIGRNNNTARQSVGQTTNSTSRQNSYQNNSSQNRQNYNQGSQGRSSSFSSGSSFGGSSSGSRSGGMSGGMGGGSRSSGSRGR